MIALWKAARIVLINIVVLVLLLALAEGGASLLYVVNEIRHTGGRAEQYHTTYDATLGWINRPNVRLPDFYGPGAYMRTNSLGFRNDRDFTPTVAPGMTRIICSGDSFTLGFGVANDQTWCQRLAALDPRLETVNMGQGGYGADQAYLWYMRDGVRLQHHLHLFAFITDDFIRMQSDRFVGYGKPVLGFRNDSLVVRNQPVPRTSSFTRWLAIQQTHALRNLNSLRLVREVFHLDGDRAAANDSATTRRVVSRVFEELARANREKGSRLVLVYLPTAPDYRINEGTASWRRFVQAEASRQGILFVDVVEAMRRVPPTEVDRLFAPNTHYSPAGNEFVAQTLYRALAPVLNRPRPGEAP